MSCAPGRVHLAAHRGKTPSRTTRNEHFKLSTTSRISRRALARGGVSAAAASALVTLGAAGPALAAANDIPTVISKTQTWLVGILAGLATLFLVIGGVRYVISGGNPGEVEKAKSAFKSAAIGYCLAILAPVVITILQSIVGG